MVQPIFKNCSPESQHYPEVTRFIRRTNEIISLQRVLIVSSNGQGCNGTHATYERQQEGALGVGRPHRVGAPTRHSARPVLTQAAA
jgi:hypothetical protein